MYRHRQLHLWITDHDYVVLRSLANERNESLSSVVRKLIKLHQPGSGSGPEAEGEASCVAPSTSA
jgi:hypothetical protein